MDKSKSAVDLSHIGQNQPTAMEEMQVKMASEASRRAEEDRMRRLRLQEEQELAYAIALSKAEAASLKKPWMVKDRRRRDMKIHVRCQCIASVTLPWSY